MAGVAVREGEAEEVADSLAGPTVGSCFDGLIMALGGSAISRGCVGSVVSANGRSASVAVLDGRWLGYSEGSLNRKKRPDFFGPWLLQTPMMYNIDVTVGF